jgi:FixJ family two-component response regulator
MQKRRTIVAVVDDDPSMLKATADLLDAHGFTSSLFTSAEEFLASEVANKADCLLLDIHLNGLSGIELRVQLKSSGKELPVIFMTALNDEAIKRQAVRAGCIDLLHKPFPAHQLINAIEKAVSRELRQ